MNTLPEMFVTLQTQVNALAAGTNPIVFFPPNTKILPKLPEMARSYRREGYGLIYYNPKIISESLIKESIDKGMLWALLGFVQNKEDAAKGKPICITVRDDYGNEVKSAVVDSTNNDLVSLQSYIFHQMFPGFKVEATTVFNIMAERLCGGEDGPMG
jgi:hypothetical protein